MKAVDPLVLKRPARLRTNREPSSTKAHSDANALVQPAAAVSAGSSWPLGAQWIAAEHSFNFALYSRHATGVTLLCYNQSDPAKAVFEFKIEYPVHKTG